MGHDGKQAARSAPKRINSVNSRQRAIPGVSTGRVELSTYDMADVGSLLVAIAAGGGWVSLGLTSDGGALVCNAKFEGDFARCYAHSAAEAKTYFQGILLIVGDPPKPRLVEDFGGND